MLGVVARAVVAVVMGVTITRILRAAQVAQWATRVVMAHLLEMRFVVVVEIKVAAAALSTTCSQVRDTVMTAAARAAAVVDHLQVAVAQAARVTATMVMHQTVVLAAH